MASDVATNPARVDSEVRKPRKRPKKRRILMIVHEEFVPPEDIGALDDEAYFAKKTECDVRYALAQLGHEVRVVGLHEELAPLRRAIDDWKPHVVFNLLEEFRDRVIYDAYIVGYLELKGVPYTGCNARGLVLARDKALSKKILSYHRIRTPRFAVFPKPKSERSRTKARPQNLSFPLIVKSLIAEGSEGIAQASIVRSDEALMERVRFIHEQVQTDAIAEEFIEGREVYAAVIGNRRLRVLPIWEIRLSGMPDSAAKIATSRVKWDRKYQARHGIEIGRAEGLSPAVEARIAKTSRRICRRLNLDGCARIDFRLRDDGQLYFLEANPNPDIGFGEELAGAAHHDGDDYPALIQKMIRAAESRAKR